MKVKYVVYRKQQIPWYRRVGPVERIQSIGWFHFLWRANLFMRWIQREHPGWEYWIEEVNQDVDANS